MSDEELQIGQSMTYHIADRELRLKPLTLGKIKRATMILSEKSADNFETVAKYILAVLDNGDNSGLTVEWIQDNVTLPEAQTIIENSRIINGLGSFFQAGAAPKPVKTERPLEESTPAIPSV